MPAVTVKPSAYAVYKEMAASLSKSMKNKPKKLKIKQKDIEACLDVSPRRRTKKTKKSVKALKSFHEKPCKVVENVERSSSIVPKKVPVLAKPDRRANSNDTHTNSIKKVPFRTVDDQMIKSIGLLKEKQSETEKAKNSKSKLGKKGRKENEVLKKNKSVAKRKAPSVPDIDFVLNESIEIPETHIEKLLTKFADIRDSKLQGKKMLSYLLSPTGLDKFFTVYWEKQLLLVKRNNPKYYSGLFSTEVFDRILSDEYIEFTKNLDVTTYSEGVRQTHNPVGRAHRPVVWDYYNNGCSLRLLNPQTFCEPVWHTLAMLQEFMGSFCGANVYLTPPGTQGFAPHWDDIEAFIIQLEGKKRWRVYNPRTEDEVLPRYSSSNLSQDELGEPVLDTVLEAGDLLYFPRGVIHQGEALYEIHSLHITISMYQKNAWVDFIERLTCPSNLARVASKSFALRQGLPQNYIQYMGQAAAHLASRQNRHIKNVKIGQHNKVEEEVGTLEKKREAFKQKLSELLVETLLSDEAVDAAADEFARQFVRVALPPKMSDTEINCTVRGNGEHWFDNKVVDRVEMEPDTEVRLLRANIVRLVKNNNDNSGDYRLYHCTENSREFEGREEQYLVIDEKHVPAVVYLISAYPHFVEVEELPLPNMEEKLTLAMALWEHSVLVTRDPLFSQDEDDAELFMHEHNSSESSED